jgi:hypothetical protein
MYGHEFVASTFSLSSKRGMYAICTVWGTFTASLTAGKLGRDWTMADLRETVDG